MAFIAQLAARFPGLAPTANAVLKPTKPLETLGNEIMAQRLQYWYRYLTTYGETWAAAKPQFTVVKDKLMAPQKINMKELAVGTVCGVQIFGSFCIGEMLGRKSVVGYSQGRKEHHH
eukprot:CAMPEP_0114525702 /NCGR_PEP_ID=MMETSP0109-20121206/22584_1 /TAXON_ID=29199 /ORGANISM="Chlorarachnion reptans, Strain CCCM449" /LENGTH=116 /DNA_ID=CAMNT_0001707339 /DNA_START=13 /DNA_END=363 /DNA_ORIENTATION=-